MSTDDHTGLETAVSLRHGANLHHGAGGKPGGHGARRILRRDGDKRRLAVEFRRLLQSSALLEDLHALLRKACPPMPTDHDLAPDIERATELVSGPALTELVKQQAGMTVLS